jgi:hypothetical protein
VDDFIKNFPFATLRERQGNVLSEIDSAFASGYRRIIVEAPTGFGKSPVAISTALTLGSSYIWILTRICKPNMQGTFHSLEWPRARTISPAKSKTISSEIVPTSVNHAV